MTSHTTIAAPQTTVLPLDDDLTGLLDDLYGIHPTIDRMCDAARDLARNVAAGQLTTDQTQTILATLAGSLDGTDVIGLNAALVARLGDPATNPALRALPADQQKQAQQHCERAVFDLTDPDLRYGAAEAAAAIDGV